LGCAKPNEPTFARLALHDRQSLLRHTNGRGSDTLRLGGYIRVSQVRGRDDEPERFASVDIQRGRIETWTRAYGHELFVVEEEVDGGGQAQRPKLLALIERMERGRLDGIVVASHRASDAARSTRSD
jgi:hypothetical protein